jgi:hypothetical protein
MMHKWKTGALVYITVAIFMIDGEEVGNRQIIIGRD